MSIKSIIAETESKYAQQPIFIQAVKEILESLDDYLKSENATEEDYARLSRLLSPERIISFKVVWADDKGRLQHNRGWRVQFNSALGPYKGGLRFDPSVNEDILKFLAFEQIFKNALTGLPMGGGKGGSDFNPKGKSDSEIRSFSRAFMGELHRYIGPETDVPAGDIGVGAREIGYMYGMYKQLSNRTNGTLTGKDVLFGGSYGRTEATGFGVVYFAEAIAEYNNFKLEGMTAVVSGAGNVAEHTAIKLIELGSKVLTLSDRSGHLYKKEGLTLADIKSISEAKANGKSLSQIKINGAKFKEGKVWQEVEAELYFPCSTQNEVNKKDAEKMAKTAKMVVEGANMPLDAEAQNVMKEKGILYAPGKAANAGGVSVSAIEMTQNATRNPWTYEAVDTELKKIMKNIHLQCVMCGKGENGVDYVKGANIAGFKKVFGAVKKLGW